MKHFFIIASISVLTLNSRVLLTAEEKAHWRVLKSAIATDWRGGFSIILENPSIGKMRIVEHANDTDSKMPKIFVTKNNVSEEQLLLRNKPLIDLVCVVLQDALRYIDDLPPNESKSSKEGQIYWHRRAIHLALKKISIVKDGN